MKDQPAAILRKLIQQYGSDLTKDSRRTEALLNDLCPTYRREVFVLVNAQRQQIPDDLLAAPKWMPAEAVYARLSRRLQDRLALSEEAADWAVRSWVAALGLRQSRAAGISNWLGKAHTGILPPRPAKSDKTVERQSVQIDVQSSEQDGSRNASNASAPPRSRTGKRREPTDRTRFGPCAWIGAVAASITVVWLLAAGTLSWGAVADFLGQRRSPSSIVESEYFLPRIAWVSDGPLLVRQGPDTSEAFLSMLDAGESVQVAEFSPDIQWSHIVEPVDGWVSNQYLNFLAPGDSMLSVRLRFQEMLTVTEDVPVHAMPDAASETVTQLAANVPSVAIAVTTDGQWRQIIRPVSGWVASANLVPSGQ